MSSALMIQGTGSDVGKSLLVAGLCRAAVRRGLRVAPFKPQNMSNNAAACAGGGEIGRAQALQAQAACIEAETDLNPVLLKPESDRAAQVVVHGRVRDRQEAAAYIDGRGSLLPAVLESFERLGSRFDLVIVEGAGSPAETNLRAGDIANMGFARALDIPVVVAADIHKGGVIASIVGTKCVLDPADAATIRGFIINKFRGDPALFDEGVATIESATGWRSYGVVPWLAAASRLPAEDAVSLDRLAPTASKRLHIVAPMLSRMANFDDADPLRQDPGVSFEFLPPGQPVPASADLVVLFGTKSTIAELAFLREQGWDHDIIAHARRGGHVLGICGGYQMLGQTVSDRQRVDGPACRAPGLGLLDVETRMAADKTVRQVAGTGPAGVAVSGYEIHAGETSGADTTRPLLTMSGRGEGAQDRSGRVQGTYVHGLFANDEYRAWYLARLGGEPGSFGYAQTVDEALDDVARALEAALDVDALLALAGHCPGRVGAGGKRRPGA